MTALSILSNLHNIEHDLGASNPRSLGFLDFVVTFVKGWYVSTERSNS